MSEKKQTNNNVFLLFIALCLIVYGLLLLTGCSTPRGVLTSQKDSVSTVIKDHIIYRDTVIYVPVPAESEKVVLQDTDTSILRTSLAESEAFVSGGELHHSLKNRSHIVQPVKLRLVDRVWSTTYFRMKSDTVTVEVERELTRWQKLLQALGLGTFVALCAALLYMAVRIVRKFM